MLPVVREIGKNGFFRGVGVAVAAQVRAGVVLSDVHCLHAPARGPLSPVLACRRKGRRRDTWKCRPLPHAPQKILVAGCQARDKFRVYAAAVPNAVCRKVHLLATCRKLQVPAALAIQFRKPFGKFPHLFLTPLPIGYTEACKVVSHLAVGGNVRKGKDKAFCPVLQNVPEREYPCKKRLHGHSLCEQQGIEAPDHSIPAKLTRKLSEGLKPEAQLRHPFKAVLLVVVQGVLYKAADSLLPQKGQIALKRAGIPASDWEIRRTEYQGHARLLAGEAARTGQELMIFAAGGDGTFNEALTGASPYPNAAVGCIPAGSGNDFLRTFGTRAEFLDLDTQLAGQAVTIDLMDTTLGLSAAVCAAGLDAQVAGGAAAYRHNPLFHGEAGRTGKCWKKMS